MSARERALLSCPACGSDDTLFLDSRAIERGDRIIGRTRRYRCRVCDERFVTIEVVKPRKGDGA